MQIIDFYCVFNQKKDLNLSHRQSTKAPWRPIETILKQKGQNLKLFELFHLNTDCYRHVYALNLKLFLFTFFWSKLLL